MISYLRSAELKRIAGAGFGICAAGSGFLYVHSLTESESFAITQNGPLFLVERGTETARTEAELAKLKILANVKRVLLAYVTAGLGTVRTLGQISSKELHASFSELFYPESNSSVIVEFVLLNV
jgi:hypothetical protein